MRRAVFATLVLTGCSFTPGSPAGAVSDAGPTGIPPGPTADASGANPTPSGTCKYTGTKLCFDFTTIAAPIRDQSGGSHDGTPLYSIPTVRTRGTDPAAYIYKGNQINVAETTDLDLPTQVSIEMWINPDYVGSGNDSFPLTNDAQYALHLDADGQITCLIGSDFITSTAHVAANTWSHVACTYDHDTLRVFINGTSHDCGTEIGDIPTNGTHGVQLGAGYQGGIDDVHVYPRALTSSEICTHSGAGSCQADCQSN